MLIYKIDAEFLVLIGTSLNSCRKDRSFRAMKILIRKMVMIFRAFLGRGGGSLYLR